jgi:hypothetical protein
VPPHPIEEHVELAPRQVVLRREVPEEGAPPDARLAGDVVDGRLIEAVVHEEPQRGMADLGVRGGRRATQSGPLDGLIAGVQAAPFPTALGAISIVHITEIANGGDPT